MLPEHHFIDDRRWIQRQLMSMPTLAHRKRAIEGYSEVYRANFDGEPEERFKVERARFAANSRLREYVAAVSKATAAKS
jgi:hypothetical protein